MDEHQASEAGGSRLSLVHVVAPGQIGGLERVVQKLAVGQAKRGHRVHVVPVLDGEEADHPFLGPLRGRGVGVVPLRLARRSYRRERAHVRSLCQRLEPDVVHTHGYRADVVDAGVARRLGIATATTLHGFTGGDIKNRFYEFLQRAVLRRFDAVIAVSRPLYQRLPSWGVSSERRHLLPNAWAADEELLPRAEARRRLGLTDDRFHIGWVGRLDREKGPDVWLQALAYLKDLPLVASFLGSGGDRERLERRAREIGLAGRIRWHGSVENAGLLYSAFDLFVLSSRTEGTPMVLFEAMAAGVPIVATRVGGVPDVLTEAEAILVESEDAVALAEAVRSIRRDPESAARRARAARARLAERYGMEMWLGGYDEIYRQIARRAGVPR